MYRVEMMVNGEFVRKIRHQSKTFLPVKIGDEFKIRVYNEQYGTRICAVVSCDGVDVIEGKPATMCNTGYIINPNSYYDIAGWRTSDSQVAKFVVSGKGESYSEKVGQGGNQGVIGVVIYPELYVPIQEYGCSTPPVKRGGYNDVMMMSNTTSTIRGQSCNDAEIKCCGLDSSSVQMQTAGTGYGQEVYDKVYDVEFKRNYSSKQVIVLYYDTPEALRVKGVPVETYDIPNPFPGDKKFCQRV